MKSIVILACLVAVALAAPPQNQQREVNIIRLVNDNAIDKYNYGFELDNGSKAEEAGELQNPGTENEAISVRGSFSYVGPDGVTYTVTYIADQNGFQPQGAHLPVAP